MMQAYHMHMFNVIQHAACHLLNTSTCQAVLAVPVEYS